MVFSDGQIDGQVNRRVNWPGKTDNLARVTLASVLPRLFQTSISMMPLSSEEAAEVSVLALPLCPCGLKTFLNQLGCGLFPWLQSKMKSWSGYSATTPKK